MKLFLCGDSTAAYYSPELYPAMGWGQVLQEFFLPEVIVENAAIGARSSKSFLGEGRLAKIEAELDAGDYLLVQFAHNDEADLIWRNTDPDTSYKTNLRLFIDTARLHSAIPILLTPISCRCLDEKGSVLLNTHGRYPMAVKSLGRSCDVPVVDMYEMSRALILDMGCEESKKLFMHFGSGVYSAYPEGKAGNTHTSEEGARAFAGLAAHGLKELDLPLSAYVKEQ